MTPAPSSSTAVSKSVALVDPGAQQSQLSPEHALQVDLPRRRVDRDDDDRAAHLGESGGAEHRGGGSGYLEHDVGPGTRRPLLDPRDAGSVVARVERREPECLDLAPTGGVELDDDDVGSEMPGDGRDQHADRPAADARQPYRRARAPTAARRGPRPRRARRARRGRAACPPAARRGSRPARSTDSCRAPGESMPMKFRFWQMCWLPARQAGTGPVPVERHHGDRGRRPPSRSRRRRWRRSSPLISWPKISGKRDPGIHRAVQDVQVGAAEPDVRHSDLHLTRGGRSGASLGGSRSSRSPT